MTESRPPRTAPAAASKVAVAGVSVSAVLGIVAYLGHSTNVADAQQHQRQSELQRLQSVIDQQQEIIRTQQQLLAATTVVVPGGSTPVPDASTAPVAPAAPRVIALDVPPPVTAARPRPSGGSGGSSGGSASGTTRQSGR